MTDQQDNDKEFETNAEGLTREEESQVQQAFNAFDRSGSGLIDIVELQIILEMMGRKVSQEEIHYNLQSSANQITY